MAAEQGAVEAQLRPAEFAAFERYGGGAATLESVRYHNMSAQDILTITDICNQPLIFEEVRYQTEPPRDRITIADMQDLVHVAERGWRGGGPYVYVVRDESGVIVASIDIHSDNPIAEIGCWADATKSGYATNAARALTGLARDAGYVALYAETLPENERSLAALGRLAWEQAEFADSFPFIRFSIDLTLAA